MYDQKDVYEIKINEILVGIDSDRNSPGLQLLGSAIFGLENQEAEHVTIDKYFDSRIHLEGHRKIDKSSGCKIFRLLNQIYHV